MSNRPHTCLVLLSGALLIAMSACTQQQQIATTLTTTTPTIAAKTPPAPAPGQTSQSPPSANKSDPYLLALDKAASARNISQSAQSQDDWKLVESRWQKAIQLLKTVPKTSRHRLQAQQKLAEYQRSLATARKQASLIAAVPPSQPGLIIEPPISDSSDSFSRVTTTSPSEPGRIYRARIKRRQGGTPVIDVTFNGRRTFEMIVDTGASGTVITQEMAADLGVSIIGKTKVDTASERDIEVPLAYVRSMTAGGATVKEVVVAIAGPALDIGLLGHDFFEGFDVTIKRDVVEFRPQ